MAKAVASVLGGGALPNTDARVFLPAAASWLANQPTGANGQAKADEKNRVMCSRQQGGGLWMIEKRRKMSTVNMANAPTEIILPIIAHVPLDRIIPADLFSACHTLDIKWL